MKAAGAPGFGARMQTLRLELGSKGPWTTMRCFALDLGVSPQRYQGWEKEDRFPGREVLTHCFAKLEAVKDRGLDPDELATWAELGPEDRPPFDQRGSAQQSSSPMEAKIEELGRIAQERALEAAISGEKIPDKYQELVRVALDVRDLSVSELTAGGGNPVRRRSPSHERRLRAVA